MAGKCAKQEGLPEHINRLEIVWTVRSPSPKAGGEGWGEGGYVCPDKYETLNN